MNVLLLLKLLFCVFLLQKAASHDSNACPKSSKCSPFSPEIKFPFRIQGLHPHHCGLPNFTLFCNENRTRIHFPNYGDLAVKSISYKTRKLSLADPKNCVHEVFLNLNLSHTPFSYYYVLKQYKYINCSEKVTVGSLQQVPCLSGDDHHVYVVEPSSPVPVSCGSVRTVAIPFSYSPYLSRDGSFGLGLTWEPITIDAQEGCKSGVACVTGPRETFFLVSCVIALVFMAGLVVHSTLSKRRQKSNEDKATESFSKVEIDKLLGEYEALRCGRDGRPG